GEAPAAHQPQDRPGDVQAGPDGQRRRGGNLPSFKRRRPDAMKRLGRILLVLATVLYPFAVLAGLLIWKTSPRVLSLCLVVILAVNFLAYSGAGKKDGVTRVRF